MNLQSDNRCSRLSPEELTRMNMPTRIPEEILPEAGIHERIDEALSDMEQTISALTRQTKQMQVTLKEMEEQRRKDLRTIQNQQEEVKKLLREKEEQVGRILDRASQQMGKSALRDAAIWWLRLLLTCLPVILVLLLAVFQGWLPLFQ